MSTLIPYPGQSVTTHPRYKNIIKMNLTDHSLKLGDLVAFNDKGDGTIYVITKNNPPIEDATWGSQVIRSYTNKNYSYSRRGWIDKRGKIMSNIKLYGSIEITPAFSFMSTYCTKKKIRYDQIKYRIKKIDIIELGKTFAAFKQFINDELQRIQETLP